MCHLRFLGLSFLLFFFFFFLKKDSNLSSAWRIEPEPLKPLQRDAGGCCSWCFRDGTRGAFIVL